MRLAIRILITLISHTKFPSRYREFSIEKSPLLNLHQIVYWMGQNAASIMMVMSSSQRQVKIPYTSKNSTLNSTLSHEPSSNLFTYRISQNTKCVTNPTKAPITRHFLLFQGLQCFADVAKLEYWLR